MLKPSLQLRLGQQLTMTPQLQQAIRLLQLPTIELQAHIRELLESNVMLEQDEDTESGTYESLSGAETAPETAAPVEEAPVEVIDDGWSDQTVGAAENPWSGGGSGDEDRQQEFADSTGQSLRDHLLWQLELARLNSRDVAIGRAVVDAINDDGYLSEPLDVIGASLKPELDPSVAEVERVLAIVQMFDPPGVGARSVSECLMLQLDQLEAATPGLACAKSIARHHLELLAERELTALRRELRTSDEELETAVALVRACHPRPGSIVSGSSAEYVVPDVFVRRKPVLCEPGGPQHQSRQHAGAAAGGALAAQEPGDSQRYAHQGGALDRRAAERIPRPGRGVHAADDPARYRRSHQHARVDRLARHLGQVHAYPARSVRAALFLFQPGRGQRRFGHVLDRHPRQNPQTHPRGGPSRTIER